MLNTPKGGGGGGGVVGGWGRELFCGWVVGGWGGVLRISLSSTVHFCAGLQEARINLGWVSTVS